MFYTDYPITEFGDKAGEFALLREVELVRYDWDKYVTVRIRKDGVCIEKSIKAGYVYSQKGRYPDAKTLRVDYEFCAECGEAFNPLEPRMISPFTDLPEYYHIQCHEFTRRREQKEKNDDRN